MARGKKSGEPGTPLIIALVFFILLSIGLGVMYYLGLADTAAEKAKAAEAEAKGKTADLEMKKAQDAAKLYRTFLGTASAEEQAYIANPAPETKDAVRTEHTRLMAAVGERIAGAVNAERPNLEKVQAGFDPRAADIIKWEWPANGALPASPSPSPAADRMVKLVAERELALKQAAIEKGNAATELKALQDEKARYKASIDTLSKTLKDEVAKLTTAKEEAAAKAQEAIKGFEKDAGEQRRVAVETARQMEVANAEKKDLTLKIDQIEKQLQVLQTAANELNEEKKGAFARNAPHGTITARRGADKTVEISLGSADNLKPGATFAVQPHDAESLGLDRKRNVWERDRSGRQTRQVSRSYREAPKGKLEVVRILGANAAEARIVEEEDDLRDGILKGDLLYNPLWRKGARDHVVLFGIFDVNGTGVDDIKTVAADLERRGVTVDGYYDLATRKWESLDPKNKTPGPTQSTTYAVRGWTPEPGSGSFLAGNLADVVTAINAASTEVKTRGVQEVRANRFFPEIGFRLAANAGSIETVNQAAIKFIKDAPPQPMEK